MFRLKGLGFEVPIYEPFEAPDPFGKVILHTQFSFWGGRRLPTLAKEVRNTALSPRALYREGFLQDERSLATLKEAPNPESSQLTPMLSLPPYIYIYVCAPATYSWSLIR